MIKRLILTTGYLEIKELKFQELTTKKRITIYIYTICVICVCSYAYTYYIYIYIYIRKAWCRAIESIPCSGHPLTEHY